MHPVFTLLLVGAIVSALLFASPQFRARLAVWRQYRQEEKSTRHERRPPRRHVESYHRAIVAQKAGVQDGSAAGTATLPPDQRETAAQVVQAQDAYIDDRTWADLDLDEVFNELDHTKSRPGQQYLRHVLRTPQTPDALDHLNAAVEEIRGNEQLAKKVRSALSGLDDPRASYLVDLIFGDLPDRPALWWVFPLLTLGAAGLMFGAFFDPRALIGLVAVSAVNICIQVLYRPRVEALIPAIHEVSAFLQAARVLETPRLGTLQHEQAMLAQGDIRLTRLDVLTRWLKFEPSEEANQIVASLYVYVNMVLLIDVNAFVFTINGARRARPALQRVFKAVGYLDAVTKHRRVARNAAALVHAPVHTRGQTAGPCRCGASTGRKRRTQ